MKRRALPLSASRMGIFLISLALLLVALPAAGATASTNTGECNQDTALKLIKENPGLDPFAPAIVVGQVLCGEFLGPGSKAMVIPIVPSTCGGYFGWSVFSRLGDGSWQFVWQYKNGQKDLVAVGADIEETVGILGPREPRCVGEKSTKTRIWHWDGQQFVAGPWTVHLKSGLSAFLASGPGFALPCLIGDVPTSSYGGASCKSGKVVGKRIYTQKAEVRPNGRVSICKKYGLKSCGGAPCGCYEEYIKVLPGEQVVSGRFTCRVLPSGVNCIAVAGSGFFMNENKVRRLG